ncbi:MAG: VOC family protein [Burkholderiales bacterium]
MNYLTQLSYLIIESNKKEEWKHYATDFLGMNVAERDDGSMAIRMDDHAYRFIVQPGSSEDLWAAGFQVGKAKSLDLLAQHLKASGVEVHQGSVEEIAARDVANMLWFNDPDGLRVEAVYNPKIVSDQFNMPLVPGGFVTGEQGFGHIALSTGDLERSEKFYRDILGFEISDYIVQDIQGVPVKFTFFHINPRHHTLAFAGLPLPNRMHHLMVEVRDLDVVGHALERAKNLDINLHMALGRHPNDRMISFYATTPSEFNVEFGCEGIEIRDEENWEVRTYDAISEWGHKV